MLPGFLAPAAQVLMYTPRPRVYQIIPKTVNPFVGWLAAFGLTCRQWLAMSDQEKMLMVAVRRFNDYGLFLSRDHRVAGFVAQVDAACKASGGPGNLSVPPAIAPPLMASILPAGQVLPPVTTTATTNPQGQVVDQNGNLLTDQAGNPLRYRGHHRGRMLGIAMGILGVAVVVGLPAYVGSYFGTRKARE